MIVKAAGSGRHQIPGFATLSGRQYPEIDIGALVVFRVRVRLHVMRSRVVVHEQHLSAGRHRQYFWRHTARRECERVRVRWVRRARWC